MLCDHVVYRIQKTLAGLHKNDFYRVKRKKSRGIFIFKKNKYSIDKYNLIVYNQNSSERLYTIKFKTIKKTEEQKNEYL